VAWRRIPEAGERSVGEEDLLPADTTWHGQMVRVFGLKARADLNGKLGFAQGLGASGVGRCTLKYTDPPTPRLIG
jgi:hypothetical protein